METTSTNDRQMEHDKGLEIDIHAGNVKDNVLLDLNSIDISAILEGVEAACWKEFIPLYQMHATTVGFNFKKSISRHDTKGNIVKKYFVCSCSGSTNTKENVTKRRKINELWTVCTAYLG